MSAQALEALSAANHVRLGSAAIRREVASLERATALHRVADLLRDPPEAIQRTRIDRLLKSIHRFGDVQVYDLLFRLRIHPVFFVGPSKRDRTHSRTLSTRQREMLATELERRAA